MDVSVTMQGKDSWLLKDQHGQPIGRIVQDEGGLLLMNVMGDSLVGTAVGPFASMDLAMKAIERHINGRCRIETGLSDRRFR